MSLFRVPDLGEGLVEVEIVAWLVADGDEVAADQPLVAVETDKATVEIPAPAAGVVVRRFGEPGDVLPIGAPLVELGDGASEDRGTVVGSLPTAPGGGAAAPAVRRLAAELGVDLATVGGTGPGGAITRADVERTAGPQSERAPEPEPLRGVRRAMATNMARAHAAVVPAGVTGRADVSGWDDRTDAMVRLVRAVAHACAHAPEMNAWYLGAETGRVLWPVVHVGVAVDADEGLIVPVLRDVAARDGRDLRSGLDALGAAVRDRKVRPEDLRGATITVSNFGSISGEYASMVVVPPQVAIVGAGRIHDAVVAVDSAPAVRRILPISITFDHRVVTGGEATRFLAHLLEDLERPTRPEEQVDDP
jgi:2-oxoisovalerate dehydrogenase E2 component (dihydrolipoyl transacylase)